MLLQVLNYSVAGKATERAPTLPFVVVPCASIPWSSLSQPCCVRCAGPAKHEWQRSQHGPIACSPSDARWLASGAVGGNSLGGGRGILGSVEFDPTLGNADDVRAATFDKLAAANPEAFGAGLDSSAGIVKMSSPPPPPRPILAVATPKIAGKPCPAGCETHGTCNRELGRCDCPPMRSGPACEHNSMPACRKQWGLELPMPPCQAFAPEVWDYRDFPPSCECLAECQAANVRVVYVTWCVNASQHRYSASMEGWPPRVVGQGVTHPWRDPFGDGRWLRQAYTPNRHQQPLTEQQLSQLNLELAARLEADGKASAAAKACSGYGLLTAPMPWYSWRQHNGKVCHCFPGWFGEQCEFGPGRPQAPAEKQYCVHGCSGRGVCKLNYCHCAPGTWGVDCGFGEPDAFLAEATKARQLYLGLAAPHGWTDQMLATPKPRPPAQGFGNARHLKIYVYDVPPQYHVWMAAHFRRSGRWDQSYLYSLDAKLHRWLLHSPYRTLDPNAADYFFIPCYLSLGFYDFEFGLYWMSNRGHVFLKGVLNYISQTFPYYNRSKGSDHILVMTNDKGATFIRGSVPQLQHVNLITQWGWVRPHIHHPESDIVVPPMLKVDKLIAESPFMGALDSTHGAAYAAASSTGYKYLLSFVGSVRFHTPGYSMGVRQKVFRLYNQTERFFLADLRGDSIMGKHKALPPKKYLEILQASKFCLAPSGMGLLDAHVRGNGAGLRAAHHPG